LHGESSQSEEIVPASPYVSKGPLQKRQCLIALRAMSAQARFAMQA